ncbi:flagellar hook-length control protein FliK [Pseudooceanicola sp. C21-150M6]|uniref:flagellar hook-length control protein FliK n=1 Tax=Pseudooceanicola sp. C21-150M6 TaxID=3434355 RepID=UPI003D7F9E10
MATDGKKEIETARKTDAETPGSNSETQSVSLKSARNMKTLPDTISAAPSSAAPESARLERASEMSALPVPRQSEVSGQQDSVGSKMGRPGEEGVSKQKMPFPDVDKGFDKRPLKERESAKTARPRQVSDLVTDRPDEAPPPKVREPHLQDRTQRLSRPIEASAPIEERKTVQPGAAVLKGTQTEIPVPEFSQRNSDASEHIEKKESHHEELRPASVTQPPRRDLLQSASAAEVPTSVANAGPKLASDAPTVPSEPLPHGNAIAQPAGTARPIQPDPLPQAEPSNPRGQDPVPAGAVIDTPKKVPTHYKTVVEIAFDISVRARVPERVTDQADAPTMVSKATVERVFGDAAASGSGTPESLATTKYVGDKRPPNEPGAPSNLSHRTNAEKPGQIAGHKSTNGYDIEPRPRDLPVTAPTTAIEQRNDVQIAARGAHPVVAGMKASSPTPAPETKTPEKFISRDEPVETQASVSMTRKPVATVSAGPALPQNDAQAQVSDVPAAKISDQVKANAPGSDSEIIPHFSEPAATRDPGTVRAQLTAQNQALSHRVLEQVSQQLPPPGKLPVEISLNPEELGRVRFSMTTGDATLNIVVAAERSETMDMLRRHIGHLERQYLGMGFESVDFSFEDNRYSKNPGQDQEAASNRDAGEPESVPFASDQPSGQRSQPGREAGDIDRIDIRL